MAKDWWKASARDIPRIVVEPPGPKSKTMHASACRYFHGLSSQVKLFPVCFEEGLRHHPDATWTATSTWTSPPGST